MAERTEAASAADPTITSLDSFSRLVPDGQWAEPGSG